MQTTTEVSFSAQKKLVVILITFLDAGLLMVDHVHFQYNGMLLGILLLSVSYIRQGQDVLGAAFYTILLMMKHIYLYAAPLYFVYLLRNYCWHCDCGRNRKRALSNTEGHQDECHNRRLFRPFRFLTLGCVVLSIVGLSFASVVFHATSVFATVKQIFLRLFPIQRGLCHAYWAPNIWALYSSVDKALSIVYPPTGNITYSSMTRGLVGVPLNTFVYLPSITPLITMVLTLVTMLPVLSDVWRFPHAGSFINALIYCMFCSFMFGFHVHEKAILQVTIPLSLVSVESRFSARTYLFSSWISFFSLFPLLFSQAEQTTRILLSVSHAIPAYILLDQFTKKTLQKRRIKAVNLFNGFEKIYVVGLFVTYLFICLFPFTRWGTRYPFLPLLVTSVYSAVGLLYSWGLVMLLFKQKLVAVATYFPEPPQSQSHSDFLMN